MKCDVPSAHAILERTPHTLRALLTDLPDTWVQPNEGPGTWSPYDIVGHLISGEELDWIARMQIILDFGERRTFEPFDREAFFERSAGKSLSQLLDEFEELRSQNLATLTDLKLDESHLASTGRHPAFGTVTLRQLLATWVVHDLSHIGQIVRVMAKQYKEAVGPWATYLPILGRPDPLNS